MKLFLGSADEYIETNEGIDLSISFGGIDNQVNAWYLDDPVISPVVAGDFIGSVEKGASVNFNNILFNPHAHGTHTESLGHITKAFHSVNSIAHPLFYEAEVISVEPTILANGDQVITLSQLKQCNLQSSRPEALILRTLPNSSDKRNHRYSHTNPPYLESSIAAYISEMGVQHLLVDLPSVDREEDEGVLAFHHAFWGVPENPSYSKTITEFIFVPNHSRDGRYFLNLQVAAIENDASPSRPVLYKIHRK